MERHQLIEAQARRVGDGARFLRRKLVVAPAQIENENFVSRAIHAQKRKMVELQGRRDQVARHMDSCILAMQNVRFDLLRLRSSDSGSALGDLTNATQQARALSRDVDVAIASAAEVRDALS